MVTEAGSIDPVQPPAAGEAGWVPARTAAAGLCTASQGPGPQPRQSAQHHPQGPHSQSCRDTCELTQLEPRASAQLPRQPQPPPSARRPSAPPLRCPGCVPARRALGGWHWDPGGTRFSSWPPAGPPTAPGARTARPWPLSPGSKFCLLRSEDTVARACLHPGKPPENGAPVHPGDPQAPQLPQESPRRLFPTALPTLLGPVGHREVSFCSML